MKVVSSVWCRGRGGSRESGPDDGRRRCGHRIERRARRSGRLMRQVPPQALSDLGAAIFAAAGAPQDIARAVAASLTDTSLSGHDSHGIMRVRLYVDMIRRAAICCRQRGPRLRRRSGATASVDCGRGFGQIGAQYGAELAADLAREHGMAGVALEEVNHIGRLGEYAETLARQGLVGIVFTSGTVVRVSVAPWGGREPLLSTNPMAWAIPTQEGRHAAGAGLCDLGCGQWQGGRSRCTREKLSRRHAAGPRRRANDGPGCLHGGAGCCCPLAVTRATGSR